jgi:hypothetical protein
MSDLDRLRPPWCVGDVDRMVDEIRQDYAGSQAPYPHSALSVSDHARTRGYSWLRAIASSPQQSAGRNDYRGTLRLMSAIITAIDHVIDERLAEIQRDQAKRALAAGGAE